MENKAFKREPFRNSILTILPVVFGLALNYAGAELAARSGLPLYIDSIGTIVASVLGGLIPGVITAIANNMINYSLDSTSIYYASVSAMIAIITLCFYREKKYRTVIGFIAYVFVLAAIGGIFGGIITWFLSGPAQEGIPYDLMEWFDASFGTGIFSAHILSTFILDLADKAITAIIALLIVYPVPAGIRNRLYFHGWKQRPQKAEAKKIEGSLKIDGHSLNTRIALMLVFASLSMAIVVTGVSSSLFKQYSSKQHARIASGTAKLAGAVIDPEKVEDYLKNGDSADGYKETEKLLYEIRSDSPDIEYLYVYQIKEDGCHVVFDLDTDDLEGEDPGNVIPFDKSFMKHVPALLRGEPIEPIETDDTYGWLLTAYEPVYDKEGNCVCYAAADVQMMGISAYEREFAVRVVLLFLGFFILILVIGLWGAKYRMILPINSMASVANKFAFDDSGDDIKQAEANLRKINNLKIRTGDEVQNLYESFCKMTGDMVKQMKNIHEQSEAIDELQRGLIITMADMVEGRDSDTGNHIRKTAAYTRIIMEGLKRKGYYADQLTEHFMDNVERSAPLHDIGKISVSDLILNKPGKLTDEEYDIMKTHTTEGKKILDQAIETVHGEGYLEEARNLAAYHHEKWNGKGYPLGLEGEQIPLSARIMAIADVFDALSSKRVYKDAMPFEKAVSIIQEDSGTHFDPKCVEAFMDSLDEVKKVLDYYNELESQKVRVRDRDVM